MGSGTTAVAALKTDRKFIGFDISQEYIDLAKRRVEQLLKQTKIPFHFQVLAEEQEGIESKHK